MAKETAKRNVKANAARIQKFRLMTIVLAAIQFGGLYFRGDAADFWSLVDLAFWTGQEWFMVRLLASAGSASYDQMGNIDSCIDLSDPKQLGFYGYAQDVLWLCWALQPSVFFISPSLRYLWAVVPIFAVWKAWTGLIKPMLAMRGGGAEQQQPGAEAPAEESNDPRNRLQRRREAAQKRGMQAGGIRQK